MPTIYTDKDIICIYKRPGLQESKNFRRFSKYREPVDDSTEDLWKEDFLMIDQK